ncbi:MAG TPA: 16S rRNA (adenine(1518)-N(6)/adenine(1519)-N(6))-dimethyltransferase RsmA [Pseudothermotoga sp.]|nr:16S rRNA (adenine(1518)-N(6)/adenine(1519)-N(6))-dimethyltransferase RsmA [Pseudothermotoga sp.]HOK82883.1 16S rRNA (adenine(1518)-N(6)/adenine(1519)-N(6))-dimethyltransferase RsmA [Pseudothermotoga sp.]HPP69944.1 16S rRNA (adenine(1518)-N(6)/adenine(1519)-N(6))-dimethyltransferase RsmA [Pseudothermotoga sp.]
MRPFGQHFLVDEKIAQKVVEQFADESDGMLVEIGAGRGFITKHLLQNGFKVVAYEIDEQIAEELQNIHTDDLQVRIKDFLTVNSQELPHLDCCVGSIPYQISSELMNKIITLNFRKAVLIVQKEFANKLMSKPSSKRYTFISVLVQSFYSIRKICTIPRSSFSPPPKVDSAMIVLRRKEQVPDFHKYVSFLRKLFNSPNKNVRNVLKGLQGTTSEIVHKRVRDLTIDEIIRLYECYEEWLDDKSGTF